MFKQQLIDAIQSRKMVKISFKKETDGDWASRDVAPYDIYPKENKNGLIEDILLGYTFDNYPHGAHTVSIYLSNIQSVVDLNKSFDGEEIRRLIRARRSPNISRDW